MDASFRQTLLEAGFIPTHYEGQNGEFLTKKLRAQDMPYFSEHVVDHDSIFPHDSIAVEVTPDDLVQLVDENSDYMEDGVPLASPEGLALLKDAGVPC